MPEPITTVYGRTRPSEYEGFLLSSRAILCDANAVELSQRRSNLLQQLPSDALVIVRGAFVGAQQRSFRQHNEFYYLTGLECPGSYLLADAGTGRTTVYVPHRDPKRSAPSRARTA
jgi:hypothetical protein